MTEKDEEITFAGDPIDDFNAEDNTPFACHKDAHEPIATGWDLIQGVAIIWFCSAVIMLGVAFLALYLDLLDGKNPGLKEILIFCTTLLSTAITTFVAWYFCCHKYNLPFWRGFAIRKTGTETALLSVFIGIVLAFIGTAGIHDRVEGNSPVFELVSTNEGMIIFAILGLIVVPFEEIYYRGFIFPVLRRKTGAGLAVILTALWFTLAHAKQLQGDYIVLSMIFIIGLITAFQRSYYDSLTPPVITHLAYNVTLSIISLIAIMAHKGLLG